MHLLQLFPTQHLRAKKRQSALWLVGVCVLQGFVVMTLFGATLYLCRVFVGRLVSSNDYVVMRVSRLAPFAAAFSAALGVHVSCRGVLRALSYGWDCTVYSFLAMWVVGLPLGLYLCFEVRAAYL